MKPDKAGWYWYQGRGMGLELRPNWVEESCGELICGPNGTRLQDDMGIWHERIPADGTRDKLKDIVECYDDGVRLDYIEGYTRDLLKEWGGESNETY